MRNTVALAARAWTVGIAPPPPAEAAGGMIKPTREQMVRLYHLEPYIEYFTALPYGPNKTRVSPEFIRALILTESSAKKWALSVDGARGLTRRSRLSSSPGQFPTPGQARTARLAEHSPPTLRDSHPLEPRFFAPQRAGTRP